MLHLQPLTLNPSSCTPHPTPCTLHPTPHTLHPKPYTPHPAPCTLHSAPFTLHPNPKRDTRLDAATCLWPLQELSSDNVFRETSARYRAVEPAQWLQRHPEAGSSYPSWPQAPHPRRSESMLLPNHAEKCTRKSMGRLDWLSESTRPLMA